MFGFFYVFRYLSKHSFIIINLIWNILNFKYCYYYFSFLHYFYIKNYYFIFTTTKFIYYLKIFLQNYIRLKDFTKIKAILLTNLFKCYFIFHYYFYPNFILSIMFSYYIFIIVFFRSIFKMNYAFIHLIFTKICFEFATADLNYLYSI